MENRISSKNASAPNEFKCGLGNMGKIYTQYVYQYAES